MAQRVQRWIEVTPSQFPHEAEGLNLVRSVLPANAPFRAWSNFEFRDGHGKWHEIDLLVLGRRRLHLVELKYYSGTLRGDDLTWRRDSHRAQDSPLKLARRKAQRLASKLQDELIRWSQETGNEIPDVRAVVPFVQECMFLHHPGLRCLLPQASRIDLFGLDGGENASGLPGISERLLEPATPQHSVGANRDQIIAALMERIGIVQRRQREAGSWVIDEEPLGEGDGWQDWPAFHRVATTDRGRIRFLVTPPGATTTERARIRQVAEHEFRIMSRLANDRLLRPRDIVDSELGVGLVYPVDDRFQRLDLWQADHAGSVSAETQLRLLREVAEAVAYAHGNRVVHRGLTPHAVLVHQQVGGEPRVLVGDWRSAGAVTGRTLTGLPGSGVTGLMGTTGSSSQASAVMRPEIPDVDRRLAEAFQAPEGVWNRDADRIRLDVFALGALAYYVLVGQPAAADRAALRERLHRDNGLDLAADLPQVPSAVRALVLEATRPAVSERLPDIRSFVERLAEAERALAGPVEDVVDPLGAAPGAVIDGRFRLERRLGQGSTAVGLLVTDLSVGESGPDATRVLKVAVNDQAAARIAGEAGVLAGLNDPRLVRLVEGPVDVGGRQALVLESAGDETLGEVLRGRERLSLDLLERWGTDLLEALVALDRAGVDHRDIKPANLGVREGRSDRAKHLVLFDFSLSRAGAAAVTAGTPPYLDPFLDAPGRGRYDSAAERYSAAVVLFEMAAGATPRFGDGLSDPASVRDEATVEPGLFDPAVAELLVSFFRTALARSAKERYDTATEMLAAWRAAFAPVPRTIPDEADESAAAAEPATPLAEAGLSARALSALEPYGVVTVGNLVAVDPVRLNRLSGVAEATRREVKARARQWRDKFGATVTGRGPGRQNIQEPNAAETADTIGSAAPGGKAPAAAAIADITGDRRAREAAKPRTLPETNVSWHAERQEGRDVRASHPLRSVTLTPASLRAGDEDGRDSGYPGLFPDDGADFDDPHETATRAGGRHRGRSKGHRVWLAPIGVVVAAAAAITGILKFDIPSHGKFDIPSHGGPAHVMTPPDRIGPYARTMNLEKQTHLADLRTEVAAMFPSQVSHVVSADYEEGNYAARGTKQIIMFTGAHMANAAPATSITAFTQEFAGATRVSAGPLGGRAACVENGAGPFDPGSTCVWFDNDSFGEIVSPTMNAASLASAMLTIRPSVEQVVQE